MALKEDMVKLKQVVEEDNEAIDTLEDDILKDGEDYFDNVVGHICALYTRIQLSLEGLDLVKGVINGEIVKPNPVAVEHN